MEPRPQLDWRKPLGVVVGPLAFLLLWFVPLNIQPQSAQKALAIVSLMIILWVTEVLDHAVTGLIGCYLFWALGVTKFSIAFSGFANDTPWFLFGAMLLGVMATKSGLARRLGYILLRLFGTSYSRLLLGLLIVAFLLTFVVPSGTARVVIVASLASGLVTAFDAGQKSNIARGLFVILTYTATVFDKVIIAGAASILSRGVIEKVGQVPVYYLQWFLGFLPCGVITILASWRMILWLYPPERLELPQGDSYLREQLRKLGPWTIAEKKCAALMFVAISLWMTDLIHHVSPAVIGLGVGLMACLPRIGVLDVEDLKQFNFLPVIFTATALGMGESLIQTRALPLLTDSMFSWMGPRLSGVFDTTVTLYWAAFVYHFFLASETAMLGTSMPLLMNFARLGQFNPLAVGMIWTFAASGKLFVYQSPVNVVGYSYGHFEAKDLMKVGALLTVMEFVVLLFLVPFYWPLVGIR
ncbi:MAG: anion permease [Acidobacteria bacterium]|nr:anion permease [Acidobacteriota bacterium]